MSRFVLLYHKCPPDYQRPSHWDLMFEAGGVLRTWALTNLPRDWQIDPSRPVASGNSVDAEELTDHRSAYLDYEGPISSERGHVSRFDAGTFRTIADSNNRWEVRLSGAKLQGRIVLCRAAAEGRQWQLTVERD